MRRLAAVLIVLALFSLWAFVELRSRWQHLLRVPDDGLIVWVKEGDSLRTVLERLAATGALDFPGMLSVYGRLTGQDQKIRRGEFLLEPGLTPDALLKLLQSNRVIQYQVTLPEGITLERALQILASQEKLAVVLEGVSDARILELVAPHQSGEGLFFPDSYSYVRGDTDWDVLQRANRALLSVLDEEWQGRQDGLPYETPYEALTMASIVERETGLAEEREAIAGVFTRRLDLGMLLQTDPTVIYGLGTDFDGNLARRHLEDATNKFNTYFHRGLPPTPIALPGRAAIRAALHPQVGEALFFVARGDGGHEFSATLEEHNAAVRKYQLQRRDDYRSTPASDGP